MRRCLLALILVSCGGPTTPDAGPPDAGPLDAGALDAGPLAPLAVATWNIENFPKHPESVAEVAAIIEAEGLDVIAVQEILDVAAFQALDDALPDHDARLGDDPDAFRRLGILVRRDRARVDAVDVLFGGDRYTFPRAPMVAEVTALRPDGSDAWDATFVIVHLKALIDAESRARRADAIEQLEAWMRGRVDGGIEPDVVLLGDFNDDMTDPAAENVFGPLLNGSYVALTLPLEEAGDRSYLVFDSFLDHVVLTPGAAALYQGGETRVLHLDETVSRYQERVSDHRPVVATFGASL